MSGGVVNEDESTDRFIAELRLERLRQRIKQRELGALLHVSGGSLSQWENGVSIPADSTLRTWASALGRAVPEGVQGWLPVASHGTNSGYRTHLRKLSTPCDPCREAHTAAIREHRQRKRARS